MSHCCLCYHAPTRLYICLCPTVVCVTMLPPDCISVYVPLLSVLPCSYLTVYMSMSHCCLCYHAPTRLYICLCPTAVCVTMLLPDCISVYVPLLSVLPCSYQTVYLSMSHCCLCYHAPTRLYISLCPTAVCVTMLLPDCISVYVPLLPVLPCSYLTVYLSMSHCCLCYHAHTRLYICLCPTAVCVTMLLPDCISVYVPLLPVLPCSYQTVYLSMSHCCLCYHAPTRLYICLCPTVVCVTMLPPDCISVYVPLLSVLPCSYQTVYLSMSHCCLCYHAPTRLYICLCPTVVCVTMLLPDCISVHVPLLSVLPCSYQTVYLSLSHCCLCYHAPTRLYICLCPTAVCVTMLLPDCISVYVPLLSVLPCSHQTVYLSMSHCCLCYHAPTRLYICLCPTAVCVTMLPPDCISVHVPLLSVLPCSYQTVYLSMSHCCLCYHAPTRLYICLCPIAVCVTMLLPDCVSVYVPLLSVLPCSYQTVYLSMPHCCLCYHAPTRLYICLCPTVVCVTMLLPDCISGYVPLLSVLPCSYQTVYLSMSHCCLCYHAPTRLYICPCPTAVCVTMLLPDCISVYVPLLSVLPCSYQTVYLSMSHCCLCYHAHTRLYICPCPTAVCVTMLLPDCISVYVPLLSVLPCSYQTVYLSMSHHAPTRLYTGIEFKDFILGFRQSTFLCTTLKCIEKFRIPFIKSGIPASNLGSSEARNPAKFAAWYISLCPTAVCVTMLLPDCVSLYVPLLSVLPCSHQTVYLSMSHCCLCYHAPTRLYICLCPTAVCVTMLLPDCISGYVPLLSVLPCSHQTVYMSMSHCCLCYHAPT